MRKFLANLIFSFQLRKFLRSGRPKFRRWIELEELKDHFIRAAEEGMEFPESLSRLLSAALDVSPKHLKYIDWRKQFLATNDIFLKSLPQISLPLLTESTSSKLQRDPWDYSDRMWYLYSHIIAKAYGWDFEKISQLKVEDAIAIIQEILTDEQLEREFLWGLSDRSFTYDAQTKQSKFVELPRPYWMKPKVTTGKSGDVVKRIKIPKNMLPLGNVDYSAVDEATKPRDIPKPQTPLFGGNVEAL